MIKVILLAFILIYTFWLLLNYISLLIKNNQVNRIFKKLEILLNKRYEIWEAFYSSKIDNKYLEELKNLPKGVKYLNRKLALNYIITQSLDNTKENIPNELKIVNAELTTLAETYNNQALKLKTKVEVFPTSIMARFLNIKTVDFYRG